MRTLALTMISVMFALGSTAPALADEDKKSAQHWRDNWRDRDDWRDRRDREHDRIEDRHDRLHDRLEERHDRGHRRIEDRHDRYHERDYWERRYRYDYDWSSFPRWRGYGSYGLRGDGWSRLGVIAHDPRVASWILHNFDYNGNGKLGEREATDARHAIYRIADRNRDGYLSQRELALWRSFAARW